jgi:hypothetical protein
MTKPINATYEGNGLLRLDQEIEGVELQERLTVLVVTGPADKKITTKSSGLNELRGQLQEFETRHQMVTAEFYKRFLGGEFGDEQDSIAWAGLYELYQRMTANAETER